VTACWLWRRQELRALVYPLAQVLLGAARLVPAPRYFPLRLRLVGTVGTAPVWASHYGGPVSAPCGEHDGLLDMSCCIPKSGPPGMCCSFGVLHIRHGHCSAWQWQRMCWCRCPRCCWRCCTGQTCPRRPRSAAHSACSSASCSRLLSGKYFSGLICSWAVLHSRQPQGNRQTCRRRCVLASRRCAPLCSRKKSSPR
jgi:Noc2p family